MGPAFLRYTGDKHYVTIHIYTTELILELKDVLFKSSISGSTSKRRTCLREPHVRNGYERKVIYIKARKKKSFPQDFSHDMRMMGFCLYICGYYFYTM